MTPEIIDLYQSGKTIDQIAIQFHRHHTTIKKILIENNVVVRKPGKPFTKKYLTDEAKNDAKKENAHRYYEQNKELVLERSRIRGKLTEVKRANTLRKFNLTLKDYQDLLEKQGGVCAICKLPPKPNTNFSVDHCHKTGKVRGLLHKKCNTGIGQFEDNPDFVYKAWEYLNGHANIISDCD